MQIKVFTPLWLMLGAVILSLGWLLPNNSPPWLSFHKEAWVACVLLLVSARVLLRQTAPHPLHWLALLIFGLSAIPIVQFLCGQSTQFGMVWMHSLYLLGFALAIQVGAKWELDSPGQCADFVFMAFTCAAVVSTGLQIFQWLGFRSDTIWILSSTLPNRYYANLTQPNVLGSLLLLGVIGTAWAHFRQNLTAWVAVALAAIVLFGVALTGSRTAWLNIFLLATGLILLRNKLYSPHFLKVALGLAAYFVIVSITIPYIDLILFFPDDLPSQFRGLNDPARTTAWIMFLEAASRQPWFGFGWGQISQAHFMLVASYPPAGGIFAQSHNMVLDLILWNGYPIGLAIVGFLGWWIWQAGKLAIQFDQFAIMAAMLILGVHSMLEFPLHYAHLLLPAGLLLGVLNTSLGFRLAFLVKSWVNGAVLVSAGLAMTVTISDYFKAENSFYGLRFEDRGIPSNYPKTAPDVVVLTQLRDVIVLARNRPSKDVTEEELNWMRGLVIAIPSVLSFYKLAANLAMSGQPKEAAVWLEVMCSVTNEKLCGSMALRWQKAAITSPQMAIVPWPAKAP